MLRADRDTIVVGEGSNVRDGCVLHADPGGPLPVGSEVTIGHGATLHGCTVEDLVLIGVGAILLNGGGRGASFDHRRWHGARRGAAGPGGGAGGGGAGQGPA